jgi:acyl-CoA hydrolase
LRVLSPEAMRRQLAALPVDTPRVVVSGNHATPRELLRAADESLETFRLFALNAPPGIPDRDGVTLETPFVGAGMRSSPRLAYLPCRLSLVPSLLRRRTPPDVVLLNTTRPRDGVVSLGVEVNVLPAAIEAARAHGGLVVAQLNDRMPFTYGDAQLAVEEIDLAIEADDPLGELAVSDPSPLQRLIGEQAAQLVAEAATIQVGIGAIPDAVLAALTARRGLRVWTEMFSDGLLRLHRAGALADAPITTSFSAGSAELYEWLDGNHGVIFARTERTNDPALISRQPAMTSINAALQVDLFAQANASYVGGRIYSGFGGQTDFVVGALHSIGGHALIALPSWHDKSRTSTIVGRFNAPATSFQHSAVITENGIAAIWGNSQQEQTRQLIEKAAAPDAREQLWEQAAELGLVDGRRAVD